MKGKQPQDTSETEGDHPKRRNRRPFPEKGLISNLKSTADKLSVVTTQAMTGDELPDEVKESIETLVTQASESLEQLTKVDSEPPPAGKPNRKRLRH